MKPLTPYMMFSGNCREAMEFYKSCFGGELKIVSFADAPEGAWQGGAQPMGETKNKVMHACLTSGDLILMASDDPKDTPTVGSNVFISIQPKDVAETQKLFKALSKGGKSLMEPNDTFWGAYFGMLTDPYGFRWMLNCQLEKQKAA